MYKGFFIGPPALAGGVLLNRVCPSFRQSFRPSFCLSVRFLGIASLVFSKFCNDARNSCEVVRDTTGFSRKIFFPQKLGKWTKMGQKQGLLNILKNFVINFYWVFSIIKIYIICCFPAQIPYLEKFWFLRYGPKYS